jgi:hypothetical protein
MDPTHEWEQVELLCAWEEQRDYLLEGAAATAAMRRSREPLDVARSLARELLDARPR